MELVGLFMCLQKAAGW